MKMYKIDFDKLRCQEEGTLNFKLKERFEGKLINNLLKDAWGNLIAFGCEGDTISASDFLDYNIILLETEMGAVIEVENKKEENVVYYYADDRFDSLEEVIETAVTAYGYVEGESLYYKKAIEESYTIKSEDLKSKVKIYGTFDKETVDKINKALQNVGSELIIVT